MSQNTITVNIPEDQDASDFIEKFNLLWGMMIETKKEPTSEEPEEPTPEEPTPEEPTPEEPTPEFKHYDVESVIDHKLDLQNNWSFLIRWTPYKGTRDKNTWVTDSHCNCESKISEYMHHLCFNTVYIICRVSTKKQSEWSDGHVSMEAQEDELRKVWDNIKSATPFRVKVVRITGSAYKNVPEQMVYYGNAANKGDIILVYRADRLSRNVIKYMSYLEDLHEKDVKIYSANEDIWFHEKKLVFVQHILDAHKESHGISQRVLLSVKRRRDRGDTIGRLSWGKKYKRENNGAMTVVEDKEATELLKKVVNTWNICCEYPGTRKYKLNCVAKQLNDDGHLKGGRNWSAAMVDRVL
jgi:DNA invertase Pin-like site-specific DNA recombinase